MEYSFTLCGLGIRKGAQRGTDVLTGALGIWTAWYRGENTQGLASLSFLQVLMALSRSELEKGPRAAG